MVHLATRRNDIPCHAGPTPGLTKLGGPVHRPPAVRLVLCAALIALTALAPPASSAVTIAPSFAFHPSGVEGAGFQNTVAFDPFTPALVLAGGDVSGISRSTDGGRSWTAANTGVPFSMFHVASLVFSSTTPGLVYAGTGKAGRGGGLLRSQDSGRSWQVLSTTPQFSGTNNTGIPGLPPVHPRSTGNLIVADDLTDTLSVGTFAQGVLRSTDGGSTWAAMGLAGSHIRSLVADPANPAMLYAATYESGVWRTTTEGGFEPIPDSPGSAEELAVVQGTLYAAAGTLGLFSYSPLTGSWDRLDSSSLPTPGKIWTSITGYTSCGQSVLYAGSDETGPNVVVRSPDGGRTWTGVPAGAVHAEVGGTDGHRWWLATRPEFLLTGRSYLTSQLAVAPPAPADPCSRSAVVMAGRSGVWGSADDGANWYPYVSRLGTTFGLAVATDATRAGRVLAGMADWTAVGSGDGLQTVVMQRAGGARGAAVTFGPNGTAYLASSDNDTNTRGELYSNTDLTGGGSWRSEQLAAAAGPKRPIAVSARTVNGATVLLTAVQGSGIWRKGGGTWKHVSTKAGANRSSSLRASFAWSAGSNVVFVYDNRSGLWRSSDAGVTWVSVWSKTPGAGRAGYLVADPSRPGRLYVSAGDSGLYRIDGATSGSVNAGTLAAVRVSDSSRVGPVVVGADGSVLVALAAGPDGTGAALLRSGDGGSTWADVADDTYRATGGQANAVALDADGRLYVSLTGNGVITGVPTG